MPQDGCKKSTYLTYVFYLLKCVDWLTIRRKARILVLSEHEEPKMQVHISCSTPNVIMNRDKTVGVVTSSLYLLDDPRSRGSIPGNYKKFLPSPQRHTGSGTHPAPYSIQTRGIKLANHLC